MLDKRIKVVGRIGDVDPLNDGGVILDHGDGRPQLIYFVRVEDDVPFYLRFTCDILDIEDAVNGPGNPWVDVAGVCACCDIAEDKLRSMARGTTEERAHAMETVAGYHGWEEFDSYPDKLTEEEAEAQVAGYNEPQVAQAETVLAHPGELWILSAERAGLQPDENARRADTLETLAKGLLPGATLLPAFGVWEGTRERSLVILVPQGSQEAFKARVETFVLSAAEAYQQDALIHKLPGAPAGLFYRNDERSGPEPYGASDVLTAGRILAPEETPQGWTEFQDGSRLTF